MKLKTKIILSGAIISFIGGLMWILLSLKVGLSVLLFGQILMVGNHNWEKMIKQTVRNSRA